MNENKTFLINYIEKLEKEYHKSRTGFFMYEYPWIVDLYPKTSKKETMFKILKQKIEEPNYNISDRLLISLGEVIDKLERQKRGAKTNEPLTYMNDIIFKLDDLLAFIIYEYFFPFPQKFNEFLELLVVLDKFFVNYIRDFFIKMRENMREDSSIDLDYGPSLHYRTYQEAFQAYSREEMEEVFDEDSYEKGYQNIKSFLSNYSYGGEYEQAVMIKIVKDKLQIIYNKKCRTKYYKGIDNFNRKKYKFITERENLKQDGIDNQKWYNAFLNKFYFQDEILNEPDKYTIDFLDKIRDPEPSKQEISRTSGYLPDIHFLIVNENLKPSESKTLLENLEKIWGIADFFKSSEKLKTNPPKFMRNNLKVIVEKINKEGLKELFENFLPYTPPEEIYAPHTWATFVIENNFLNEISPEDLSELLENNDLNFLHKIIKLVESYKKDDIYFREYIYKIIVEKSPKSVINSILRIFENDNLDDIYQISSSGILYQLKQDSMITKSIKNLILRIFEKDNLDNISQILSSGILFQLNEEEFITLIKDLNFTKKILRSQFNNPQIYNYDQNILTGIFYQLDKYSPNTLYQLFDYILEKGEYDSLLLMVTFAFSTLELEKIIPALEKNNINFLTLIANKLDEINQEETTYSEDDMYRLEHCCDSIRELCDKDEKFKNFIKQNIVEVSEIENNKALAIVIGGRFLEYTDGLTKEEDYKLFRNLIRAFDFLPYEHEVYLSDREFYETFEDIIAIMHGCKVNQSALKEAIKDSILEDEPRVYIYFFKEILFSEPEYPILGLFDANDLLSLVNHPDFPRKIFEIIKFYFETDKKLNIDYDMDVIFCLLSVVNEKLKDDSLTGILKEILDYMSPKLKEKLNQRLFLYVNININDEFGEKFINFFKKLRNFHVKFFEIINQEDPRTIQKIKIEDTEYVVFDGFLRLWFSRTSLNLSNIEGFKELKNLKKISISAKISEITDLDSHVDLEELILKQNKITEIKGLEHLPNLKVLSLNNNQLTEIKGLNNLENLEELHLDNNQISEIQGLEHLPNLKALYLNNNRISEIKGLKNLVNLERFSILKNQIPRELENKIGYTGQNYVRYCQQKKEN